MPTGDEGTYQLTVLPPVSSAPPRPRDLVLVLDRSGSMGGWKMVAARRAAARIVDTLTGGDRFAVLTFDDRIDRPAGLPDGLVEASDRNRYRAVEHLARVDARGGTELLAPLRQALALLRGSRNGEARDAVVILVTDGQVGNEDQLLRELSGDLQRVRVHTVGIDQAVNAGFLRRLASVGGGRCELVESEDRLDEAMDAIHRRIGAPLAYSLALRAEGLATIEDTASPARIPDLFPGVPLVVTGRYRGSATGSLALHGTSREGGDWSVTVAGQRREAPAVTAQWARAHLRDLEDRYASAPDGGAGEADRRHVVAVRCVVQVHGVRRRRQPGSRADGGLQHRVMQPVEAPAGWDRRTDDADMLRAPHPERRCYGGAPSAEPMPSAPADAAAAMPSQPAPSAKASSRGTNGQAAQCDCGGGGQRVAHRRRLGLVAQPGGFLLPDAATAWWPARFRHPGMRAPRPATRAGVPENTVAVPEAPRTTTDPCRTAPSNATSSRTDRCRWSSPSPPRWPTGSSPRSTMPAGEWTRDRSDPDHLRRQ